jgi:hypothetical protein
MAYRSTRNIRLDNETQAAAFRKAARELGCEPNEQPVHEQRFKDALRTMAKAKPSLKNARYAIIAAARARTP